jgi:hypothetical protein
MAKKKGKTAKRKTKGKSRAKGRASTAKRRKKSKGFLGAITTTVSNPTQPKSIAETGAKTAIAAGSVLAGLVAGLAAGKYSFYSGVVVTGLGVFLRRPNLALAGLGMAVTPNVKTSADSASVAVTTTTDGATVSGIDVKQVATGAKDRITGYFKNFTEKITCKKSDGMSGLGEEPVTYFVNPYASRQLPPGSLDMSALDKVQEQIAMMSGGTNRGTAGFDEDISTMNF